MKPVQPHAWTILSVLQWAHAYLQAKGISETRAAAEVLLAHCLQCNRLDLYLRHDQPLSEDELGCYKQVLKRRLAREPTQYITGQQEFWSLNFRVTPAVLIPRPETEVVVEVVLRYARTRAPAGPVPWILDVGTGSGVLPVVLAKELPAARVVAVDRSWPALEVARENIRRHAVQDRVSLVQGDLAGPLACQPSFDIIVANLPYVPTVEWEGLPPEIRDYEPRQALDGGPDGLALIRPLTAAVPVLLKEGGMLALEVGQGQAQAVVQLLQTAQAFCSVEIIPDYQRIGRVVAARQAGEIRGETAREGNCCNSIDSCRPY